MCVFMTVEERSEPNESTRRHLQSPRADECLRRLAEGTSWDEDKALKLNCVGFRGP